MVLERVRQYADQLWALLPTGLVWRRSPGTVFDALLQGCAGELARLDKRSADLLREADPRTTTELLVDWERVCGLPDPCVGELTTVAERRAAVVQRLTQQGGQSVAFLLALGLALGYAITIEEFRPFQCGISQCTDPLSNGDWIYTFQVHAPEFTVRTLQCGVGRMGEPLRTWRNDLLECAIQRAKPAHTHVLFAYDAGSGDHWFIGPS
ncbi:MAG: DUF2313 domain-containing protein [Planctomycetota bacterium]|nr:MAG: DUF2313 domain-containing protein [Planctomycetota bacterium]